MLPWKPCPTELLRRTDSKEFQSDLELVLRHFGPVLAENSAGLYRELLRRQRTRREFGTSPRAVQAFLAIALGAAQNEDVAKETEGLEGEAFAIATDAARRGGRRAIAGIESHSKSWPKSARAQWGFLVEAIRPKEIGRSLRELSLFAAGAKGPQPPCGSSSLTSRGNHVQKSEGSPPHFFVANKSRQNSGP